MSIARCRCVIAAASSGLCDTPATATCAPASAPPPAAPGPAPAEPLRAVRPPGAATEPRVASAPPAVALEAAEICHEGEEGCGVITGSQGKEGRRLDNAVGGLDTATLPAVPNKLPLLPAHGQHGLPS